MLPAVDASLRGMADKLSRLIRDQSFLFKKASMKFKEEIVSRQAIQARVADNFIYLFAMVATLSKLDGQIRKGEMGPEFENDRAAAVHFMELAEMAIEANTRKVWKNADQSMLDLAETAIAVNDLKPNSEFVIPEKSPVAAGTGLTPDQTGIEQFPGDSTVEDEIETFANENM
jgi:hypothetical protein